MKHIDQLELLQIATPSGNPDTGCSFLYFKSDGKLYRKDTNGVETLVEPVLPRGVTVLGSDVINNNATANTIADVTGLSFALAANGVYKFRFFIFYTAAATTTGSRWSVNTAATITQLIYRSTNSLTATSRTFNEGLTAVNLPAASNATSASTTGNVAEIEGMIKVSTAGTLIARFASSVSGSAITAKGIYSYVEWEKIG